MYELSNNNNSLSDQTLERVLARVERLVDDGSCRFEAGITDTAELGKVSSLNQIFKNAVLAVCKAENIDIDARALDANIEYSKDGPVFGGIPVGGYQTASFKRNIYAREFAQVFRTAMGPDIRSQMVAPLRASLAVTPVMKLQSLVAA
jgi:hypothetical protein